MKKSIVVMLGGIVLGIVVMLGVFSLLNLNSSNEKIMAQNKVEQSKRVDRDIVKVVAGWTMETISNIKEEKDEMQIVSVIEPDVEEVVEETTEEITEEAPEETIEDIKPVQNNVTSAKHPYYIKVNRWANCVTVYTLDAEGNYTVPIKAMTCSVGTNWSTPLGVSKISDKYTWRLLFGNTHGHYSVRFNGHILFHSVPYLSPSNDTLKEGQFNMLGQPASQGCIRLCVADAKWIYDNCPKGTLVEVYDSEDPGPLGKPSMPQINPNSPYRGWDPTDPNPSNPWLYGGVMIHGATDYVLTAGEYIDIVSGVFATDVDGLAINVAVNGSVDFNTAGTYLVTYSATGVLGHTATQTITITIVPSNVEESNTQVPNTEVPGTEIPNAEVPSTEVPGTDVQDTEIPNTEIPSTEVPNTEIPNTEVPNTEVPNTEVPSTEIPNTEVPGTEIPNAEEPGTEIPNTEVPGTEIPNAEEPGTEVSNVEAQSTEVPGTEIPSTELPEN